MTHHSELTATQKRSLYVCACILVLALVSIAAGIGCHMTTCLDEHTRTFFGFSTGLGGITLVSFVILLITGRDTHASVEMALFQIIPSFFNNPDEISEHEEVKIDSPQQFLATLLGDSDSESESATEISLEDTTTDTDTSLLRR
eukprot:TRINITY_DN6621_c0_g1_i1.p1 TRINITY_DN6621_c0_g1~~TRINITY_DN6621_c0_g1_i1.p1  ORF type:complete len:144 (-),score=19.78 TRINITY_DN6621_c0_g1_i1:107-538(-)